MKTAFCLLKSAGGFSRELLVMTLLFSAQALPSHAEGPVDPPLLEFAVGLAGNQVRLTWNSEASTVYRIERSSTLAAGGGGGWAQVGLVEATGAETSWVDLEATKTKNFYRVTQPVAEVSAITPPVISTTGGALVIDGQGIPAGSFLVLEFDGQTLQVPLAPAGGGLWDASVSGQFLADSSVIATGIVDGTGAAIVSLNTPITVTATGRALDAPPTLPPGAPVVQDSVKPISGIGIVVKRNPGSGYSERKGGGKVSMQDFHFAMAASGGGGAGKATFKEFTFMKMAPGNSINLGGVTGGGSAGKATFKEFTITKKTDSAALYRSQSGITGGGSAGKATFKEFTVMKRASSMSHSDQFTPQGIDASASSSVIAAWLGKKGYDYYQAKSNLNSAGLHQNPYYQENSLAGNMVGARSLPGEVHIPVSALSLACPAGPNIDWVCTYRSMAPVNSAQGQGWDFSYNIYIEPLPAGAGASATRVAVYDGQGRRDVFHRQPDGSFRCAGMFREGRFNGEIFTLTFADTGKWVFKPLGDRLVPGKIAAITDRNGVSLTCDYDGTGKLGSVSSQFGQSISVVYSGDRVSSITDHAGRTVSFTHYTSGVPGGSEGDLYAISSPLEGGQPLAAQPVTFTYSTGSPDPRLNGNLLSATDGAGRLLGAFTYSAVADPLHISYDSCASAEHNKTGHVTLNRREPLPPGISPQGGYTVFEIDEVGRVTETVCDRLHRPVSVKQFTGFSTPNFPVTSTDNRPTVKLRPLTDPDFFETRFAYNADSLCTRLTCPDGSQEITTYDRDFRRGCPVREGGNPRVMTLRTPLGEERTVSCGYLSGYGTLEPSCHTVKSPRDAASGLATGKVIGAGQVAGITGGAVAGIVIGCAVDGNITAMDDWESPVVRMVSAHGQVTTCSYDTAGNLLSVTSPVPGRGSLYEYNTLGQLTSATTLNGPGSSFTDACTYDPTTSFLSSVVCDSGGLNLTTTCDRDTLGRITRVIDPRGNDELRTYNALDQIVEIQSAPVPQRVATTFHYDSAGYLARCDLEHRDSSGVLVLANPAYSSFFGYDSHGLLVQTAEEERPVDGSGTLDPNTLGIENFAVCDITLNNAGECVRLSTPADCRAQDDDLVCDFTYDERGLLHRTYDGGTGNIYGLVTECDYDFYGAMTRYVISGQGITSEESCSYDGFHRLSSETDPMGNVCNYEYDNQGYVTCSVFGEVNDVAGSAGNVLLARAKSLNSTIPFEPNGAFAIGQSLIIPHGAKDRRWQPGQPVYGNITSESSRSLWSRVKNNNSISVRTAFFGVETEDETVTQDRFTPGGPITQEITTIDRSPAGLVQQISRNGDVLETCSYDTAGRLIGQVCGDTSHLRTLNPNGDVTSSTRTDICPSDATQTKTFTTSHVIDAAGRCVQTTDGTGNITSCAYDSLHRPVSLTEPGGLITRCAYDGVSLTGPFSEEISADALISGNFVVLSRNYHRSGELRSSEDSYGHTTTCDADSLGRIIRCDNPDGTFETRGYNHISLVSISHLDHGRTTATFDLNGRPLTSQTTSDPNIAPVSFGQPRTFTHDGLGRCTNVSQGGHDVACAYDSLGNLLSENQDGRAVSSTYSHRGRSSVTYPTGQTFEESRDSLGLLLSVSALAGGAPVSPPVVVHQYAGSRIIDSTQANGIITTYEYRGDGEQAIPGGADFTFDACVKVSVSDLSITIHRRDRNQRDRRFEMSFAAGADAPLRSKTFTRDRLGRVTVGTDRSRATAGAPILITGEVSYALDLEGRRVSATGGENPGSYEQLSTLPPGDQQMGQYSSWPRGPLEWDDNGNLTAMATTTGTLSLVHDVEGRLTSVSRGGIPVISYDYDPIGRCILRDPETGPATTFIYDGDVCIQELGADGGPDLTHVFAAGIRQCISTRNGTIYYPHGGAAANTTERHHAKLAKERYGMSRKRAEPGEIHENLNGRDTLLTSSTGTIIERYDCDDAGKPVFLDPDGLPTGAAQSTIPLRWMAPECAWEPEIGMFHCPGGLYSPDLGTGVSSHKIKPEAGATTKKNYVGHITLIKQ